MAAFIEHDGEPQLPPPYRFPGVSIIGFVLESTMPAVQSLCDKYLNIGSPEAQGFYYKAASNYVLMEVLHYPRMECTQPPFSNHGFSSQNEIYFRVSVTKLQVFPSAGFLLTQERQWFVPFIFVDNPWSLVSGREVVAYPKNLASFDLPISETALYPIKVSTHVIDPYAANTPLCLKEFVEVRSGRVPPISPLEIGPWPWSLPLSALPELERRRRPSLKFDPFKATNVGLKQFRDAKDPRTACYQALVQSELTVSKRVQDLLPPAEIILQDYASLPIIPSFGFASPNLTPVSAYKVQCDFTLDNCQNTFVATC